MVGRNVPCTRNSRVSAGALTRANWWKPSKIAQARGSTSMAPNGAPNFRFAVSDRLGLKDFAADFLVVARIP